MISLHDAIPHRPPFLLLDTVISCTEDAITAETTLRADDPLFAQVYAGHYPGNPITPGVLLCEMIFQAGAVLMSHRLGGAGEGVPVLTRIRDTKFRAMVRPGDTVTVAAAFEDQVSNAYSLSGTIHVKGTLAVRTSFVCALVEPS